MDIGLKLDKLFEGVGQGLRFESCSVGVETTNNNTGFFALIDSSATDVDIIWNAAASTTAQGSMVIENVAADDSVKSVRKHAQILLEANLLISTTDSHSWRQEHSYRPCGTRQSLDMGQRLWTRSW